MDKDKALNIISTLLDDGYDAITLVREYPQNEQYISITVGIESPVDRDDLDIQDSITNEHGVNGRIIPTFDIESNSVASIMVFDSG